MSDVVTGEAVPLELRLAKLPSRALAIVLDWMLLAIVAFGVVVLASQILPGVDQALGTALVITGMVFVAVILPTTVETLTHGKSVGKHALGLRVVRDDGGPIVFRHALVRALAGVFVDFVGTLGVGAVVCSLLNPRGKRLGDLVAGTIVVRERVPTTRAPVLEVEPGLADWASSLELSQLPDGLALAARTLLARASHLTADVQARLATDLARQVAGVVSPPAPPNTPALTYLSTVLAERRRRDALRHSQDTGPSEPDRRPPPSPRRQDDSGFTPPV